LESISESLSFQRLRGLSLAPAVLVLAAGLSLAGCGSDKVAKPPPETQEVVEPLPLPEQPYAVEETVVEPAPVVRVYDLTPPPGVWPETKVALLVPLSGRHAKIGQALLNAAQLALFDISDEKFALVIRDTGGTPEGARLAVQSTLEERVGLVLGPLFASSVFAVAEESNRVGINLIAFSNDRNAAGPGILIAGLPPDEQIARVVDYAARQGLSRFALLAPRTAYGDEVVQATRMAVLSEGAELVRVVSYAPAAEDIGPEIRLLGQYDDRHRELLNERERLAAQEDEASELALERLEGLDTLGKPDFEAVLLPAGGRSLLSIAPSLAYYDVDPAEVQFLGTALWNDVSLGTEPTLVGGWFAAPSPVLWDRFRKRYQDTYGEAPPRIASLAYDLVALAAVLARTSAGPGRAADYGTVALTQPSGFAGIDGIFRFSPSGVVQRGLAVLEMGRGSLRELEPAPQTFEAISP
jgi:ABC-type branched-subunit amino acid transport system substrate-binding protein